MSLRIQARVNNLSSYQIVNSILAAFILLMFTYSAVFSPQKSNHPIPSSHTLLSGEKTSSTGLSRAFSSIVRFQFRQAREYNPYSLQIFSFFFIQLALRLFINFSYNSLQLKIGIKRTVIIDSIISGILFLVLFEPFWREISLF